MVHVQAKHYDKQSIVAGEALRQAKHYDKQSIVAGEALWYAKHYDRRSIVAGEALRQAKHCGMRSIFIKIKRGEILVMISVQRASAAQQPSGLC